MSDAALPLRADEQPIPVVVLSGFLGSGKTTLLNALLLAPKGSFGGAERMAVIVNEFGAVGIDGALVAGGEQFVELDNGCLCCALNEDLVTTLEALVARGGISRILIETTGIADPLPVAWACTRPQLSAALRLDAIITVVDGCSGAQNLAAHETARLQVERADLLLVSKCDAAADGGKAAAAAARAHNEVAPLLYGAIGAWPLAALFQGAFDLASPAQALATKSFGGPGPRSAGPGRGHAHSNIEQVSWQRPVSEGPLEERAIENLAYAVPEAVIRFKGLFWLDAEEGPWLLVHGVAGRIDLRFCTPVRTPSCSSMVFFGEGLASEDLLALCRHHLLSGP